MPGTRLSAVEGVPARRPGETAPGPEDCWSLGLCNKAAGGGLLGARRLSADVGWIPSLDLLLLTTCNTVGMSVNVSVRLDERLAERLRLRARAAGETLSDRLRRYAEEGARRDEHPMITFRDGPTGRRAGLIGGPDVWEVAMWIEDLGSTKDPAAELAADGVVPRPQIDAVRAYQAAYQDEIQARIELHRSETAAAEAR